jgi:hypothetical protein
MKSALPGLPTICWGVTPEQASTACIRLPVLAPACRHWSDGSNRDW